MPNLINRCFTKEGLKSGMATMLECISVASSAVVVFGIIPVSWYIAGEQEANGKLGEDGSWNHNAELSVFADWIVHLCMLSIVLAAAAMLLAPRRWRARAIAGYSVVVGVICFVVYVRLID